MSDIELQVLTPGREWQELVAASPGGTLFHTSEWLSASGKNWTLYGIYRKGNLVGGMPVTWYGTRRGPVASMPPLTPYLGPFWLSAGHNVAKQHSYSKRILISCVQRLQKDFRQVELKCPPEIVDMQPFVWNGYVCGIWYTYRLGLKDLEAAWQGFTPTRRNDIRKAQQDGIKICPCSVEAVLELVQASFARQDNKVKFQLQAMEIDRVLSPLGRGQGFIAQDLRGNPLASAYLVNDEKRSYYLLGGYDPSRRHHGAGALLIWELMQYTQGKIGLNEFDFEGSMIPPVERYFRDFGAKLTPFYTARWAASTWKSISKLVRYVR